jgi:competence protein ComEA
VSRHQLVLGAWAVLVLGLLVRTFASALLGPGTPPAIAIQPHVVDVNSAGVHELCALPGIGITRAEAIVLERIRRGAFRGLQDMGRVDGLGQTTLDALRGVVVFGPRQRPDR